MLELPYDKLSSYSASLALQRLGQLTALSASEASAVTFVQRAVLRDLCETAVSQLDTASGEYAEKENMIAI